MKKFRKLISVILTVIMIMSVMPAWATQTSSPSSDIPDGAIVLFDETFDSGYTLNQNWFDVADSTGSLNEGWTGVQKLTQCYTYGNWDIQSYLRHSTTNTNDSISVVDVSGLNLGGNFSGNALRLYNDRATGYDTDYMSFRRNFNGTQGISLTSGEYAGKKLVYEADVKIVSVGAYQSSFFVPSRVAGKIYDYPSTGTWKATFQTSGKFRVEEGVSGPANMWYNTPASAHNYKNEAGKIKVIFDQSGAVDTITVYNNGEVLEGKVADVLSGHKRSGSTYTELQPTGNQGQEFNFSDTIYGVWGNVSNMEIYVDNFRAYLIDELPGTFKVSQVAVNSAAFDAEVDTVEFTFTNEIDNATVTADKAVLLDAQGREVNGGIASVALKEGDNKTLSVTVTNALASETNYTVALKDGIKDVNGNLVKREQVWYEYPINDYYTATNGKYMISGVECTYTAASGSLGAKISNSAGKSTYVDCYISQMTTEKTTASFKTCRLLAYESASPANEAITDYVKGQEQEIVLQFNDLLADTVDIANAFVVKDEDEREVAGLAASFGDAKNIVKLQLKDLELGNGVHTISSKPNALYNAAGKGAIITYKFDTVDFTATASESGFDYLPKVEKDIEVTLSLPTTLTADSIATGFEVKDDQGNTVSGLGVTMVDNKTITLQLKDLQVEKGVYTINATSALTDSRGLTPALNLTFNVIEFKATTSEGSGFQLKPGEEKTITVTLSLPTTLTADNIATGFKVENSAGREISGLGVTMVDNKTITLQLKDLVVDNGKYYIKATSALTDAAGRVPEMNLMFNVAKEVILFEEDFEFGYTLNENWVNNANLISLSGADEFNYRYGDWEFQADVRGSYTSPSGDSISVVDVSDLNLGAGFSGNALKLSNTRTAGYDTNYLAFRRNFNGTQGISLTRGEYAGKKLVYEADVKIAVGNQQSSFFVPSRKQVKIFDYANDTWKNTFQTDGKFRVEEGGYATAADGPTFMWYKPTLSAHSYQADAGKIKIILDQTGVVDTITVYNNGAVLKSTSNSVLNGHKRSGLTYTGLLPAGYQGQEFNFADTIYGIWGSVNASEIYVDNFKAYLIDSFSVSDAQLVGNSAAFEPSTDSIVYTFTGEVDPSTINDSITVLDSEGNKVINAVKSATLEEGGKKLRVTLAKSLNSESGYKVVLNDTIRDIYGSAITQEYEWYAYPINEYYTATNGKYMISGVECTYTPASGSTGAKISNSAGKSTYVDCYIPYTPTTNREVEFTTAKKIKVDSITPAAVPTYDLGKDQVITIKFEEVLADNTDLSKAFIVTDKDGKNIPGLAAEFGETKDIVKLQLSGLQLGDGKHIIESVDGKLANEAGLFANVSISFNTVDFMVIYAEPGAGVITEYVEGKDQTILLGLSSPATLAAEEFATGFEVVDENGAKIEGIQATYNTNKAEKTDDDTITLQLSGLRLGKGVHTIKATDKLVDRRGRKLEFEYSFTILPFKATYEKTITGYEPKTEKAINIELTYPLNDESANAINETFIVENQENLRVSGLTATVSEDKKVITLQLKDLDITGGSYKITSKDNSLVSIKGEQLATVKITVNTASKVVGDLAGEGAGSGSALPGDANFATVVLLDENFENSPEKLEKGIEFTPYVNWYTSPDKKPSVFTLEKIGSEYRDAEVKIVKDPADPDGDNMVLMNKTGYYGLDGSVIASAATNSTAPNYHIVKRALDKTDEEIKEEPYTVIRMSSRIYVPSSSVPHIPLSTQYLRNASYILAATSKTGKEINDSNFARHTDGSPKFYMYSDPAMISTGVKSSVDKPFTPDEWHTIEFVFSANEFAATGELTPSNHVYLDGKLLSEASFASDYATIDGMMSKIVGANTGDSVVVYYDDWKIIKETKFRTHVDVPQQNVKEDDDITLTLTKKLNAESVKLIEDSLKDDTLEDLVTVKDSEGNTLDANITITNGNVITIVPNNGLKYQTDYILEVKATTKVNGIPQTLKSEDGEAFGGLSYPFATAKALNVYIDAEASKASFNCFSTAMETATRFTYTMNLSGAHDKDVIAAVAAFNEKEELIGIQYVTISSGSTAANFDFNTFAGKTGAKIVRMYIWEAKTDGSMGRLMQLPDEITSR